MANGYTTGTLEAFVEAVQLGSFSAVARKRGMIASSIARQITGLERELGVPLFIRTTRALELTEAGRVLFLRSENILRDLANAKREAISLRHEVTGLIRVSCLPTFGKKHIIPHLSELFDLHPKLRISLDLTERLNNPLQQRTDLMFRIGKLKDSTLVSSRFATQTTVIAASPRYLARKGTPRNILECATHSLIDKNHAANGAGWRELLGAGPDALNSYLLQTDDFQSQVDACVAGLGIVRVPDWAIYDRVESGEVTLLSLAPSASAGTEGIYLLKNRGLTTAAIKAFCNHLERKIGSPAIWQTTLARFIPSLYPLNT
jgi:DNA-binding transcriptional LysR family regulator